MACTKFPILGYFGYGLDSNDGTLCRLPSPAPGPIGIAATAKKRNEIKYFTNSEDGWTLTKIDGMPNTSLPSMTKVDVYETRDGREYYTIKEGPYKGKKGSVISTFKGRTILSATSSHTGPAKIVHNLTKKKIIYDGKTIDAFTQNFQQNGKLDPLPVGTWKIKIADFPHNTGGMYTKYTKYETTWFPIETPVTTDRYIHVGSMSHGCSTIGVNRVISSETEDPHFNFDTYSKQFSEYTGLYEYLISSRKDDTYIGIIEVVK